MRFVAAVTVQTCDNYSSRITVAVLNLALIVVHILSSTNSQQSLEPMIFTHPLFDRLKTRFSVLHSTPPYIAPALYTAYKMALIE